MGATVTVLSRAGLAQVAACECGPCASHCRCYKTTLRTLASVWVERFSKFRARNSDYGYKTTEQLLNQPRP